MKLKCPNCKSFHWIEGDTEIDCDRGTYVIEAHCTCGTIFVLTFECKELIEVK